MKEEEEEEDLPRPGDSITIQRLPWYITCNTSVNVSNSTSSSHKFRVLHALFIIVYSLGREGSWGTLFSHLGDDRHLHVADTTNTVWQCNGPFPN